MSLRDSISAKIEAEKEEAMREYTESRTDFIGTPVKWVSPDTGETFTGTVIDVTDDEVIVEPTGEPETSEFVPIGWFVE